MAQNTLLSDIPSNTQLENQYFKAIELSGRAYWFYSHIPFDYFKLKFLQKSIAFSHEASIIERKLHPKEHRSYFPRTYNGSKPKISYRKWNQMENFAKVSMKYCHYLRSLFTKKNNQLMTILTSIYELLMGLQKEIFMLPDLRSKNYKQLEEYPLELSKWPRNELSALLGPMDSYYLPIDETHPKERVKGCLTCDLGDIYDDLSHGLRTWALGSPWDRVDATVFWRDNYEIHWKHHLHSAISRISELLYQIKNQDE